ncbi:GFA family protein [Mariluticola halotolerans]|uniref:GFA family protein n=1 Tax=Mariluticola halotolerans TaxID=2909283 RepID=UPI0026E34929|nr:GFA family protein [Mariluticola halotolerans]UJQ95391.1 GFA family protein [Mariluticola halotolerans]
MRKNPLDLSTHCACGAVAVRFAGVPLTMMLCTCKDCQKATGTGHSALALVRAADLQISGETRSFSVTANSGHSVARHFCPHCGTPIMGQPGQYPDLRLMPAGLFDEGDWFSPKTVIFHRSHHDWDVLPDIPAFNTYKEN